MRDDRFVVQNLRETYHEPGEYEVKIVLDPKMFKNSHDVSLTVRDSDGRDMPGHQVKRWGRKLHCSFVIDDSVADGVASVRMDFGDGSRQGLFSFWVIK